jgi:hypothetical protein
MSRRKRRGQPTTTYSGAEHIDGLLDEALRQSFPASDAVAIDFRAPSTIPSASNDDEPESTTNGPH